MPLVQAVGDLAGQFGQRAQTVRLLDGSQLVPGPRHQEFLVLLNVPGAEGRGDAAARIEVQSAQPAGGGNSRRCGVPAGVNRRRDGRQRRIASRVRRQVIGGEVDQPGQPLLEGGAGGGGQSAGPVHPDAQRAVEFDGHTRAGLRRALPGIGDVDGPRAEARHVGGPYAVEALDQRLEIAVVAR